MFRVTAASAASGVMGIALDLHGSAIVASRILDYWQQGQQGLYSVFL